MRKDKKKCIKQAVIAHREISIILHDRISVSKSCCIKTMSTFVHWLLFSWKSQEKVKY